MTTQRTQYNDTKRQLNENKRSDNNEWFIKFANDTPVLKKEKT